ncbi:MAG: hypothetical protein SWE60_04970 [Thermodesulfobacteriota bacterium]|nr:hypothetical protein [Thermodesulfobacteriota bacterium]
MTHVMNGTYRICLGVLCCFFTILSSDLALAVNPSMVSLQQKMGQLASLRQSIVEKTERGTRIRQQFKEQRQAIVEEIRKEQERMGTESYQKALQCPRIDYALKLLQRYDGYLSEIDRRLTYFETVDVQLAYLLEQAEDDMKIIETLHDMDIAALVIRIESVLDAYLPEAEKPLIRAKSLPLPQHQGVWNAIVNHP